MFRLRDTAVSGFPHAWLTTRMPYTASRSPLLTPDVRISRIRRSQIPLAAGFHKELMAHLHRRQPQLEQVLIPGSSLRGSERPLAPPAQVPDHTLPNKSADHAVCPAWIAQLEVFPPALQVAVQSHHKPENGLVTHGRAGHLSQGLSFSCQALHRRFQVQVATLPTIAVSHVSESVAQKVQTGIFF